MDDLLYNACLRYFTSLSHYGYRNEEEVKKLLLYVYIHELVNTTSVSISEEDYKHIENALYCLYGTTCLIPYPKYCENPMYLHLGDIVELSRRVDETEQELEEIKNAASPESQIGVLNRLEVLEDYDLILEGEMPVDAPINP